MLFLFKIVIQVYIALLNIIVYLRLVKKIQKMYIIISLKFIKLYNKGLG
jgi:hypothetical protein